MKYIIEYFVSLPTAGAEETGPDATALSYI